MFLSCGGGIKSKFVEYQPHVYYPKVDSLYLEKPNISREEIANIAQVLEFYGEDYEVSEDGIVYITRKLNEDWELVWNYTTKSRDENWLKVHRSMK